MKRTVYSSLGEISISVTGKVLSIDFNDANEKDNVSLQDIESFDLAEWATYWNVKEPQTEYDILDLAGTMKNGEYFQADDLHREMTKPNPE